MPPPVQGMAVVLIGIGFGGSLAFANLTSHFDGAHKIIGVLVTVMLVIQPLNGLIPPSPRRPGPAENEGASIGRSSTSPRAAFRAFVLAAVNIFLAPPLFEMYGSSTKFIMISAAVLLNVAVLLAAGAGLKTHGAKQDAAQDCCGPGTGLCGSENRGKAMGKTKRLGPYTSTHLYVAIYYVRKCGN